jgi:GDPmannose 4,6-dehydratase
MRDWGFAADYVEGLWQIVQCKTPDDFVLATGETHSVREFVETAFQHVGIDDWQRYVRQDPAFMRPADVDHIVGDSTKARQQLGWKPKVSFVELVQMMVDSDINDVRLWTKM